MRCAVFGCNSDNQAKKFSGDVMFFRFPSSSMLIKRWINACRRSDKINPKNARVCSRHFKETDFKRNLKSELLGCISYKNCRQLNSNAVPTENLPTSKPCEGSTSFRPNSARKERSHKRCRSKTSVENLIFSNHALQSGKEASCREDTDATTAKKIKCDPSSTTTTFLDNGGAGVDQHPQFLFVDADAAVKCETEYTEHEEKPNVNEDTNICIKNEIEEPSAIKTESSLSDVSTHTLLLDNITKTYSDQSTSIKTEYTRHEQKLDVSDQENYWVKTEVKEEIEIEECSLNSETFIM